MLAQAFTELVLPGRSDKPEDLPRNSGAVLQAGRDKVAVFKDENGVEHTFAAACPHLGCLVQWNPLDGTFGARPARQPARLCWAHACARTIVVEAAQGLLMQALLYVLQHSRASQRGKTLMFFLARNLCVHAKLKRTTRPLALNKALSCLACISMHHKLQLHRLCCVLSSCANHPFVGNLLRKDL